MNYRTIFKILGRILCVEAAFMLPAMILSRENGSEGRAIGLALADELGVECYSRKLLHLEKGQPIPKCCGKPMRVFD